MNSVDMEKVIDILRENNNFLLSAHVNPEGDSIGSLIAMRDILGKLGKEAVMVSPDSVPDNLKFLKGAEDILTDFPEDFRPEVSIVLDCPVLERTGKVARHLRKAQLIVNIDHHVSNEYFGDGNWVEPGASSVGEMLFCIAGKMDVEMDADLAAAIYAAIITDTGRFSYNNTTGRTHVIAGELIVAGVDPGIMHDEIFEKKSVHEVRLLGSALATLQLEEEGKVAHISLTRDMYSAEGVDKVSTEVFIGYPRSIKGVEVAVFFKESITDTENIYVSFRSSGKIDVNALASRFGGGGHKKASGCMLVCGLDEAKEKVLAEARKLMKER